MGAGLGGNCGVTGVLAGPKLSPKAIVKGAIGSMLLPLEPLALELLAIEPLLPEPLAGRLVLVGLRMDSVLGFFSPTNLIALEVALRRARKGLVFEGESSVSFVPCVPVRPD